MGLNALLVACEGWWWATPGSLVPAQLLVAHAALCAWAAVAWTADQPVLRMAALVALATSISLKSPRIDALALGALLGALAAWRLTRLEGPRASSRPALPAHGMVGPLAALGLAALAAMASQLLFEGAPHIADSAAQWFHGRILAGGALAAPLPATPAAFAQQYVIADGQVQRWYSLYPPGHIAALALGWKLGAPWLVNPVLGGLAVVVFDRAARNHLGANGWAAGATLGLAVSPFVVYMSAEAMNHSSALAAACLLLYAGQRLHGEPLAGRWWLVAGAAGTWCGLTRPVTAVALSVPVLGSALWHGRHTPGAVRRALRALLPALCGLAILVTWHAGTTGDPWVSGYARFFATAGPPVAETGIRAVWTRLAQATDNAAAFNVWALGWPAPALGLAWLGARRAGATPFDRALGLSILSLAAVHAPYFYQDLCFGPRFWFEATPAALLLAVGGVRHLAEHARPGFGRWVLPAMLACAVATDCALAVTLYARPDWWGPWSSAAAGAVAGPGNTRTVVLVEDEAEWRAVAWRNDPWLRQGPVFARVRRGETWPTDQFAGWRIVRAGAPRQGLLW
ncbi:MAG: glycosyltransferase family 39 protein [Deltaproteobacteria bacterium]|nr:glycosyltransferase family 39 protein [Deltaproteobacteria bacterium]